LLFKISFHLRLKEHIFYSKVRVIYAKHTTMASNIDVIPIHPTSGPDHSRQCRRLYIVNLKGTRLTFPGRQGGPMREGVLSGRISWTDTHTCLAELEYRTDGIAFLKFVPFRKLLEDNPGKFPEGITFMYPDGDTYMPTVELFTDICTANGVNPLCIDSSLYE